MLNESNIKNPILPGFYPDASAVCVGEDYYIATSTFDWWPGVEIFHSKDLVNWAHVCCPITRQSQINLLGNYNSGGIWAPHLSYFNGLFYLVYTDVKSSTAFKDTINYVITAPDISGPWSEPTFVTASGFDPALFHDDDGRHYFLNMLFDWRLDRQSFAGTVIQEIDINTLKLKGERKHFYRGNLFGVCEGPQIIKKDGYYYLLCAVGGTGYAHAATVARAKTLSGPFEEDPKAPLLTTADNEDVQLQKSGHACFINIGDEWYITHICARPLEKRGRCTLGRETSLQKIEWVDGWPRLINGTKYPDMSVPKPKEHINVVQKLNFSEHVDFSHREIPATFKTLRKALISGQDYTFINNKLRIFGKESLSSLHNQNLFARRWQSFNFEASTSFQFNPTNFQQTAGLVAFYDTENWFYAFMSYDEDKGSRYLRVMSNTNNAFKYESEQILIKDNEPDTTIYFEVNFDKAQFFYDDCKRKTALGNVLVAGNLSDDFVQKQRNRCAFTGAMVGICCQDLNDRTAFADFLFFDYSETDNKA